MTQRFQLAFLTYDSETRDLITLATGDVSDVVGAMLEQGTIMAVSQEHACLALHMYSSVIKVVPTAGNFKQAAYNVRIVRTYDLAARVP